MLHDIKRSLGENADKEYMNHINLLKMIKLDIESEKLKFTERIQGAEMSLFIENIFIIDKSEPRPSDELRDPASLVQTVLEKKMLIEQLQEKMAQRLDVINNMLASHALPSHAKPVNRTQSEVVNNAMATISSTGPDAKRATSNTFKMFENSYIQQSDLNMRHFHFVYNFYNKNSDPYRGKSPRQSKRPTPIKPKKIVTGKRRPSIKAKRSTWFPKIKGQGHPQTIAQEHELAKPDRTPQPAMKPKVTRRNSNEGTKTSQLLSDDSEIDRDESDANLRLYYADPKLNTERKEITINKPIANLISNHTTSHFNNRESLELSPLRIDENIILPFSQSPSKFKRKLKTKDLVQLQIKQMRSTHN